MSKMILFSILYFIVLCSILFVLIPIFFSTVILSWVVGVGVKTIARLCLTRVTQRFDDHGALFAAGENLEERSYINVILHMICKGSITVDQLCSQVQTKLLSWEEDPEKKRKFGRLKERWTTICGFLFWEPIPNFNPSDHIRLYDHNQPDLQLPSLGVTEEDLRRISSSIIGQPYAKGCPWEILLIPNYLHLHPDGSVDVEQHCVILFRFHHALMDASGVNEFLESLFDSGNENSMRAAIVARLNRFPSYSPLQDLLRIVSISLRAPFHFTDLLCRTLRSQNEWFSVWRIRPQDYYTYFSDAIPLSLLEEARKLYGVSSTAVVHTLITGAILRIMKENGQECGDSVGFYCAYPLEGHPGGLTNHL